LKRTKAIEILDLNIKEAGTKMPPDVKTALQMSSGALQVIGTLREQDVFGAGYLLPGETPD